MNAEKRLWWPFIFCLFCVVAHAQETKLELNKSVEREIAGGESHSYQITLHPGQLVRFRLEQQTLDSTLLLAAPDDKPMAEVNWTDAGQPEVLVLEALQAGNYHLTVRGVGTALRRGAYRLETTASATATPQDRKHLAAQTLLLEADELAKQIPQTAPQVIEKLEQALPIWRELGVTYWVALTLNRMGRTHIRQNQNQKAIPYLEQSLALQRELKNRFGEGAVLNNLANAYFNQRQFEQAGEIFEQALAAYRAAPDRRWEGLVLNSLGNTNNNLNRHEKAIAYFEQALTILREVKDHTFEGQALTSLGNVYLTRGQSEKAIATTEAAIARFREVKDRAAEGLALNNLGVVYSRIGRSEKAVETLELALTLFRELKERTQEGNVLTTLGTVYGGMGQTEKAIAYFEQGLTISRALKDKQRESVALSNLGLAYTFLNQYEKAIEYLEQALPLSRESKNRLMEGATFSYLGTSYAGLSRFEKAIESHEQALAIFREIKHRLHEGNTLQNLGNVYKFLGRDDKAVEYYAQTLPIFQETKYRVGEGNVRSNLGSSYERLGRYEDAIRSHEQALAIFRELKYQLGEGMTLTELGVVYARLNQHEKALELYAQAITIHREVKSRDHEALALFRLGESKQKLARVEEAVAAFTESAAIFRAIGTRNYEFGALTSLAKTERARGNLRQALTVIEQSVQIVESLRAELISPENRTIFLANVQETYQLYADLLMQLHKSEPAKGMNAKGVEISERQRARSLLDLLVESRIDLRQGVDTALITQERALAKQLNDKAKQLTQASKLEQTAALKQEISQLETSLERAQAAIRKASPRYAALTHPQPLTVKEIQHQLDADTLLLEYALGAERSYLWAITKETLTSYELPKEEMIEKTARQVYELLTARSRTKGGETAAQQRARFAQAETQLAAAAQALSQTLLAPVAAQLGNKRLVVVADGALQYVPFAMLPEPVVSSQLSVVGKTAIANRQPTTDNRQPLIVRHEIISLPSASALAIQRKEFAGRQAAPKTLAVIADPVFERNDARLTAAATASSDNAPVLTRSFDDERSIVHLAEKSDEAASVRKLVIPRLPFTRQEATRLLALAPKTESFSALDFQANRAAVLNSALSQYRYVHFATHGVLDSERPGLSSLLLSMVDEQGKVQDGFLRANDIYNLKLPAELVVLSACQTGLGKEIKGEGLVGLTRGFMYAGAARVVVSLWNVNDQATAELMAKFYQKMLKQGERPAAALRAAQVELWKQKQWNAPFYWAAFTLQGEWR
ncbi:MAG TPA: tetratricopeptide repeat protein [Blastocatellia bacterium]|nr:tetratricopeptide repeat protein [Blastocatellia bacterium]